MRRMLHVVRGMADQHVLVTARIHRLAIEMLAGLLGAAAACVPGARTKVFRLQQAAAAVSNGLRSPWSAELLSDISWWEARDQAGQLSPAAAQPVWPVAMGRPALLASDASDNGLGMMWSGLGAGDGIL